MNYKKNILAAALLITPMALWAHPGGGPPAGVGGGIGGAVGGAIGGNAGGVGHAPGGVSGSAAGSISGTSGASVGHPFGMSQTEAHRLDVAAKKAAAKAKADAAGANGSEHANENAAFGQETAAQARTLKDADLATRQAFGSTVSARAKDQGKGTDESGGQDSSDNEVESDSTASAAVSTGDGAAKANAKADFGQTTAAGAQGLKDADVDTRKSFGGTVQAAAKAKTKPTAASTP